MEAPDLKEVFASYFAWKATEDTWIVSFMNGTQFIYLLEGSEKALLTDTGYAVPGLRAFVEKLTDKPIEVINTHFHPDHGGGNGEWERVILGRGWEADACSVARSAGDLNALPHPDYEKVTVDDGYVIELGGRSVEVLRWEDCHCHSSVYLLDRGRRMLFMGDEMDSWQVLIYDCTGDPDQRASYCLNDTLHGFLRNLRRVKELDGEYDWLMANHNGAPLAKSYVDDFIGLVEHIYAGDAVIEDKLHHRFIEMDPSSVELCRVRWNKASIITYKDQARSLLGRTDLL